MPEACSTRTPSPALATLRGLFCLLCLSSLGASCGAPRRALPPTLESAAHPVLPPLEEDRPRTALTVLISIDQLRADMPVRLLPRFKKGGFRRLYEEGVVYDAASYAHSATETAVGHATLSTGALPRDHGIVGNEWSERNLRVYAVDDAAEELLGASGTGKSPVRLLSETIGDVLAAEQPTALLRSVSGKERSAILLGGRKATAYWLDEGLGSFITSRYYAERTPPWVAAFAQLKPAERYRTLRWELLAPESEYVAADDHPWEQRGGAVIGSVFPHAFGDVKGEQYVNALKSTPFGDELTLAFVRAMFDAEPLGRDRVPDLLTLSFSSTDYVGHAFGPESREAEDNLLRLDRTLAQLFELLDERVGKSHYVVFLTADHGACESPDWFTAQGLDAGRVDPELLKRTVEDGLRTRFDVGVELVSDFVNPTLVLNEQRIAALSLDLTAVEHAAVELALTVPGVYSAHARSDLLSGAGPDHPFKLRMEQSTHPERSGHVYIVPKEHWLLATKPDKLTAMHGTPWPYDASVPILVWGTGSAPRHVSRAVDPRDIAPSLARLLSLRVPSSSTGSPLVEALPSAVESAVPGRRQDAKNIPAAP
ncbi:MAG: alkaline phosphatase [Myxococcaceae bacterium]|nr:alkaline phosphatase [Myxococcaceae bacterium]